MRMRMMAALAALAVAGGTALSGDGGKISWGKDHAKALAEAKESGKPLLIFFTADW